MASYEPYFVTKHSSFHSRLRLSFQSSVKRKKQGSEWNELPPQQRKMRARLTKLLVSSNLTANSWSTRCHLQWSTCHITTAACLQVVAYVDRFLIFMALFFYQLMVRKRLWFIWMSLLSLKLWIKCKAMDGYLYLLELQTRYICKKVQLSDEEISLLL